MRVCCRLSIFIFVLATISIFGFKSSQLLAQDYCLCGNIINGTLSTDLSALDTLSSEVATSSVTAVNGSSGSMEVVCTNVATNINISGVSQFNNAGIALSTFTTTLTGLSSKLISHDGAASVAAPIGVGSIQIEIDLTAAYNGVLRPGNYSFLVGIEATP